MDEAWIIENLMEEGYFEPKLLGAKRELFHSDGYHPLITLYFDEQRQTPKWKQSVPGSFSKSLILNLMPLAHKYGAFWFFVENPDDIPSCLLKFGPLRDDEYAYAIFYAFEWYPAHQYGAQYLAVIFADHKGMIVLERSSRYANAYPPRFEIAYYGEDERWGEVSSHL